MKAGDIVWTEAYGHISKWIVLDPNCRELVKLYHIQEDERLVERDEITCLLPGSIFPTETEAIQKAIEEERAEFENRLYNHNTFLEKMAKKLGQTEEQK